MSGSATEQRSSVGPAGRLGSPKGTRDFFPEDMARHLHLLDAWRRVSVRHGFEQVDGPIFEKLDLYKIKSGEGIVSELFSFRREGGTADFALRPEFTPTLARMVAERAHSLPKPIKWFCTPNLCRAERPQRGRLREFWQWNADVLGSDSPVADAECMLLAIDFLAELGLSPDQVRCRISHRATAAHVLRELGLAEGRVLEAFDLLDRRAKITDEQFCEQAKALGLDEPRIERLDEACRMRFAVGDGLNGLRRLLGGADLSDLAALDEQLQAFGIAEWCEYDLGIVRGLAYYTGTVFELHEATGVERALAGGGRYDNLIELFGGPPTPAVGFGMGDVVLANVLQDKGLLPESADVAPRPDAFVLAGSEAGARVLPGLVGRLRRSGLHVRFSYKTTRNVGRLLKEADASRARFAVILGDDAPQGRGELKDLKDGGQEPVRLESLPQRLSEGSPSS